MKVYKQGLKIEHCGKYAGKPTYFVYIAGCSVECSYCAGGGNKDFNVEDTPVETVIRKILDNQPNRLSLVGGNPFEADKEELKQLIDVFTQIHPKSVVNLDHPGIIVDYDREIKIVSLLKNKFSTITIHVQPISKYNWSLEKKNLLLKFSNYVGSESELNFIVSFKDKKDIRWIEKRVMPLIETYDTTFLPLTPEMSSDIDFNCLLSLINKHPNARLGFI